MSRRCVFLRYSDTSRIVSHWCAPGLAGPVAKYVADTYGHHPIKRERHRSLWLDAGGALLEPDNRVHVDVNGWRLIIVRHHLEVLTAKLRKRLKRPPKMYGAAEAVRLMGSPDCMMVLTPADARVVLAAWSLEPALELRGGV